jgi:hypothetical protein
MINLIIYEIATGRVARQITVLDEYERDQNLREGEAYLLGSVNPATCYVENGEVKAYPEKPQAHLSFDFAAEAWVDARDAETIARDLDEARQEAISSVTQGIGRARQRFITALPGQDMIYLRKEAEARAFLAASDPSLADYPMIAAEVGVTAETAYQVAQVWIYMSQSWQAVAASLEAIRLTASNAIGAAADDAAIAAALAAFEAALSAASGSTPV